MFDTMPAWIRWSLTVCAAALLISGCGDDGDVNALVPDADATVSDTSDASPDASPDAAPDAAPDASPDADAAPDVDLPPDPSILRVRYVPEGDDFYRMPWPSDARRTAAGTPALDDFPHVDENILTQYRAEIEARIDGFSTMPVVYAAFDQAVAREALPAIADTVTPTSPIQLIDLSEAGCGERLPIEVVFNTLGDRFLDANVLEVAPAFGWVLSPSTPYALVILDRFGADGQRTARPDAFDAAFTEAPGADPALAASLAPLRRCLPSTDLDPDAIAVATVFTTQDTLGEMVALRDAVMDPQRVETRPPVGWTLDEAWSRPGYLTTFTATVEMPIFQEGQTPYDTTGGALIFDADGQPVIQRWEPVPVAVAVPDFDDTPPGPLPVLVFIDGTGWDRWGHLGDNWIDAALEAGYVVASFMPQFHGGRAGFRGDTDVSTFNFFNPPAVRSNFRQQAAETSYFIRVLREQLAGQPGLPDLDTSHLVYGGQSQGALCGAIVAAVEDQFDAYVFNGLSAYLSTTIVNRKDLQDYEALIQAFFRLTRELDRFYPIVQLAQLGAEALDGQNFARLWRGWEGNPGGSDVLVVNGFLDATTTPRAMDHLTITGDLGVIAPSIWIADPYGLWEREQEPLPISGNRASFSGDPVTIATYRSDDTGHSTIYQRRAARDLAIGFWTSSRDGAVPVLDYPRESLCSNNHDDDRDGLTDCDDPDCAAFLECLETHCADGDDDDNNGLTDCDDPRCAGAEPCRETACTDEADGDGDDLIDCADPDCAAATACLEHICDDGLDDDNNGLTDCDDALCLRAATACPVTPETACDDNTDDDGDGLIDCADPDCALADCNTPGCADGDLGQATGLRLLSIPFNPSLPNTYPPGACQSLGRGAHTPDLALRWRAPESRDYTFSTEGSTLDTVLSLHADCDTLPLACDDDHRGDDGGRLTFSAEADVEYILVISAYDAEHTEGQLQLSIW